MIFVRSSGCQDNHEHVMCIHRLIRYFPIIIDSLLFSNYYYWCSHFKKSGITDTNGSSVLFTWISLLLESFLNPLVVCMRAKAKYFYGKICGMYSIHFACKHILCVCSSSSGKVQPYGFYLDFTLNSMSDSLCSRHRRRQGKSQIYENTAIILTDIMNKEILYDYSLPVTEILKLNTSCFSFSWLSGLNDV